ncbi:MAG: hypothetical protein FWG64_02115 [Firmicutes bacterium]|nr:hypothetical protein [Bacillota bacterium]
MRYWIINGEKHLSLATAEQFILDKLGLSNLIGKAAFINAKKLNKELKSALISTEYICNFYGVEIKCYTSED